MGDVTGFLTTVGARVMASADGIERTARSGDPACVRMLRAGVAVTLRRAVRDLAEDAADVAPRTAETAPGTRP